MAVTFESVLSEKQEAEQKNLMENLAGVVMIIDADIARLTKQKNEIFAYAHGGVLDYTEVRKLCSAKQVGF